MTSVANSITAQQLSDYTLIETIYDGARTTVYRALAKSTQQPVVIKVLSQRYPRFSDLLQFRNQYTVAKNLDIPSVVRPLTLESCGNGYALVMEGFMGVDLAQYRQQHPLNLSDILNIALQLTDILHDLHQRRVIHKDIKPANILIHPDSRQVKLIDFSIASLLPKETQAIQSPKSLEGTLAYMAPEQTGRMNRAIDYRTDFYALGVTLYQLLTGQLPFSSSEPLELIHCHMAQVPTAADQVNPAVPSALARIVAKLMAKNAEDRYQSALGLKYDLEQCFIQWKRAGEIQAFELGHRDLSDRFLIPEKLYGREVEVQTLLNAFNRVAGGTSELILVAGFSGIGKTAVVNEVHKPITQRKGYFIKGKFDQFNRNIPLSAFIQTLRDLIGQLLSESDTQLQQWKRKILHAIGENGQVIVEVIPELEIIIGQQPPVPKLSGSAAQNRFNLLLIKFLQVFTTEEHPLVIFLDDLQWADSASLGLINLVMSDVSSAYLLIIGAYRDNEVFPAHPLMLTLDEVRKVNSTINTITLASLSREDINCLVADALSCRKAVAHQLTDLIYQKTEGNPFFTTQFLSGLYEENLIQFDTELGYWGYDIAQVQQAVLLDDVVEFMAQRLQKLPADTQEMLKLAACIGNQFNLGNLAIVSEQSSIDVANALWRALQAGLVLPNSQTYKFFQSEATDPADADRSVNLTYRFLHDRVQQAAYSLIPNDQKQTTHLKIGRLLLEKSSESERDEKLFDIVSHLNIGHPLITLSKQRDELAQLNLRAGQKAKSATAYRSAINYLTQGIELLESDHWKSQYALSLALHEAIAEAIYLSGAFEQLDAIVDITLKSARTLLDKIAIYETKIQAHMAQNQLTDAIKTGLNVLKQLGIELPQTPNNVQILIGLVKTKFLLRGRAPKDLVNLPIMTKPEKLAAMRILSSMISPSFIGAPKLLPLVTFQQVQLSIQYGNMPLSAFAYAWYGTILCGVFTDINIGYEFGQLALNILEKFNAKDLRCRTGFTVNSFINPWKQHLSLTVPGLQSAYQSGVETGDLEYAAWSALLQGIHLYWGGDELSNLSSVLQARNEAIRPWKQNNALVYNQIYYQAALNLTGNAPEPSSLSGPHYSETQDLPAQLAAGDRTGLFLSYLQQLQLHYLFDEIPEAVEAANYAKQHEDAGTAMFPNVPLYLYDSLTQLATCATATRAERRRLLRNVTKNQRKLKKWSQFAPENSLHSWYLVEAEKCRVLRQTTSAIDYYDRAIAAAKASAYQPEEALAHELAAKFYLNWDKQKIAATYMQSAYYCYARWGAKAKTAALEARYPELLQSILQQPQATGEIINTLMTIVDPAVSISEGSHPSSITTDLNKTFDFASILKASQVLSGTIELDELLRQLTQIILQNSGGDRCALLLPDENEEWQVRAITTAEEIQLCSAPLDNNPNLPVKLIQYVKNIQEAVVIDNLETDLAVVDDYLREHQPKSVLCLPILNQGRCIGIILLENRFTSGIFTDERIVILNFLCTQAGISLENAVLYESVVLKSSVIESSNDGIAILEDGNYIYLNEAHVSLLGYELDELMGQSWEKLYSPAEIKRLNNTAFPMLAQLGQWSGEATALRKDGSTFAQEVSLLSLDNGKLICICRDISDRKAAEQSLLISESKFRTLLSNLDGAVYRCQNDADWTMEFMSNAIEELSGYLASDFINNQERTYASLIHPDDTALVDEAVAQGVALQQPFTMEYRIIHRDGSARWVAEKGKGIFDDAGELQCLEGVIFDISDRKQADDLIVQKSNALEKTLAELQNTQLQLVQGEKMSALGGLVAGVAHEINNPVGCILGNVQATEDYVGDLLQLLDLYAEELTSPSPKLEDELEAVDLAFVREDLPQLIRAMKDSGDRIKSISKSLRTFSRADTDQKQAFNLHEGIDSTVLILRHRLKANEQRPAIEVITNYGDIPNIDCFPGQLNQVFMNILANAIDALDDASQSCSFEEAKANPQRITIQTGAAESWVTVAISDNGPGIPEDIKTQIFDHLFTTKGVGKGTGLGLAIARQIIVDNHQGTLKVNSEVGEGTEFSIQLPLQRQSF
ncbi:MAG: AAA family ATPase [Cyanobacteria bacterium P01_D01_bin.128]